MFYGGNGFSLRGIIGNNWSDAKTLRRFTLRTLKDLGMGKTGSESIIAREVLEMKKVMKKMIEDSEDGVINIDTLFHKATLNVIWTFIASERFDYDDEQMNRFFNCLNILMKMGKRIIGKPLGLYPILRHFPPHRRDHQEACEGLAELRQFVMNTINNHRDTLDANNPRDFIDQFLLEFGNTEVMTEDNLLFCCMDFFMAGSETSSKTLLYCLAFLINNPEVQAKIHKELSKLPEQEFISWSMKD